MTDHGVLPRTKDREELAQLRSDRAFVKMEKAVVAYLGSTRRQPGRRIPDEVFDEATELLREGMSIADVQVKLSMHHSSLHNRRQSHKALDEAMRLATERQLKKRIPDSVLDAVAARIEAGVTTKEAADQYGVSVSSLHRRQDSHARLDAAMRTANTNKAEKLAAKLDHAADLIEEGMPITKVQTTLGIPLYRHRSSHPRLDKAMRLAAGRGPAAAVRTRRQNATKKSHSE